MHDYQINEYKNFNKAEKDLKKYSYGGGITSSGYQNYEVMKLSSSFPVFLRNLIERRPLKLRIFVVFDKNRPVFLAPVRLGGKYADILGGNECFDKVDFVYFCHEFSEFNSAFQYFLSELKIRYGIKIMYAQYILENSFLGKALADTELCIRKSVFKNVAISRKTDSYESYIACLSKSTRQNLRTSYNRLEKENMIPELYVTVSGKSDKKLKKTCLKVYNERQFTAYHKNFSFYLYGLGKWSNRTLWNKNTDTIMIVLRFNGNVAAFLQGYKFKNRLDVFRLAISDEYRFYSPGMVLISETMKYVYEGQLDFDVLDLCRGEEEYKYRMGGEVYNTTSYELLLI